MGNRICIYYWICASITTDLSGSKRGATDVIQTTYGSSKRFTHDASGRDLQVTKNCMFMLV